MAVSAWVPLDGGQGRDRLQATGLGVESTAWLAVTAGVYALTVQAYKGAAFGGTVSWEGSEDGSHAYPLHRAYDGAAADGSADFGCELAEVPSFVRLTGASGVAGVIATVTRRSA